MCEADNCAERTQPTRLYEIVFVQFENKKHMHTDGHLLQSSSLLPYCLLCSCAPSLLLPLPVSCLLTRSRSLSLPLCVDRVARCLCDEQSHHCFVRVLHRCVHTSHTLSVYTGLLWLAWIFRFDSCFFFYHFAFRNERKEEEEEEAKRKTKSQIACSFSCTQVRPHSTWCACAGCESVNCVNGCVCVCVHRARCAYFVCSYVYFIFFYVIPSKPKPFKKLTLH